MIRAITNCIKNAPSYTVNIKKKDPGNQNNNEYCYNLSIGTYEIEANKKFCHLSLLVGGSLIAWRFGLFAALYNLVSPTTTAKPTSQINQVIQKQNTTKNTTSSYDPTVPSNGIQINPNTVPKPLANKLIPVPTDIQNALHQRFGNVPN
ncbi:hypothetical protein ACFLZV_06500 [Candidatus Margulisiibacteriota bacterium]